MCVFVHGTLGHCQEFSRFWEPPPFCTPITSSATPVKSVTDGAWVCMSVCSKDKKRGVRGGVCWDQRSAQRQPAGTTLPPPPPNPVLSSDLWRGESGGSSALKLRGTAGGESRRISGQNNDKTRAACVKLHTWGADPTWGVTENSSNFLFLFLRRKGRRSSYNNYKMQVFTFLS